MKGIILPLIPALTKMTTYVCITTRRHPDLQEYLPALSADGKQIFPRTEKAKQYPAAGKQPPCVTGASRTMRQFDCVKRTIILYADPDTAQPVSGPATQWYICLLLIFQAKSLNCQYPIIRFYCSSFAFTRYSPPVTPPKRYFPIVLVLVTAIRCSCVTSPTVVT